LRSSTIRKAYRSDDEEKFVEEISSRLISVHGDVRDVDEVIDELLNSKDKDNKRRFVVG